MNILTSKFKYDENKEVCGLTKELNILYIFNYFKTHDENVIILTSTLYEANTIYKSLRTYTNDCLLFPMDEFLTSVALAISPDFKIKRLEIIDELKRNKGKKHILITSLMGYLKFLPNLNEENSFIIKKNASLTRDEIIKKIDTYGYTKTSLVTTTGEYAIRGYIIDIFPINNDTPIRIEFFGDDIEAIKTFDEESQLSLKELQDVQIKKINETPSTKPNSLLDYMPNNCLFVVDKNQVESSYKLLQNTIFEYKTNKNIDKNYKYMFEREEMYPNKTYKIGTLNSSPKNTILYKSNEIINFNSNFNTLKAFVNKEIKNHTIIFALDNDKQVNTISDLFNNSVITSVDRIIEKEINIIKFSMNKGFLFENIIVITPFDIDCSIKKDIKYKNSIKIGTKIKDYRELKKGDYIVHESYGIGIYNGLNVLKTSGYEKDYIEILYFGSDKIYVPVENISNLYKYSDAEGIKPKLDKLNSSSWSKRKLATRKKIKDISEELLALYTSRSKIKSTPYKDYDEEMTFAFAFPYTLTKDQDKAIKEINIDLKKSSPMDRLLCGDVGYGKTEVAFRAMLKTVLNGHQVAYLCPTTILSKQQYDSAVERFKETGVNIELVNRHITTKKFNSIIDGLAKGTIDIVIGTHKLLNKKIKYKSLGLLVIDEEQRFGVTHKEKIKEIKNDVNVLTLSATPIPRTLKIAMSGLRSLSILDTPPINRYPIETYVIEENDILIKDAIYKELSRNGQIYMLINSIEMLSKYASKIEKLVPEAKLVIAHGQMDAKDLNNIMENFINKEYDILLCTTIIETGIDISNVNTIIVLNSEQFGLSQLYQIRGRVGRSDKIAYAYLMYKQNKVLTETAIKRLNSIKEFTELGSGYKIAMRDLAIRGAGDLLGKDQAGFIDAVGIDLYTKMLSDEITSIKNNETIEEQNKESNTLLPINTHIDNQYVEDESIRIEIHMLINSIKTKSDFDRVKFELNDRFGQVSEKIEIYMLEKCIENIVNKNNIKVNLLHNKVNVILPEDISNRIDGEKLFIEAYNINPKFELAYKSKKITINLITSLLKKNYMYYLYELLDVINNQINNV